MRIAEVLSEACCPFVSPFKSGLAWYSDVIFYVRDVGRLKNMPNRQLNLILEVDRVMAACGLIPFYWGVLFTLEMWDNRTFWG
jgi:hypothetical protein